MKIQTTSKADALVRELRDRVARLGPDIPVRGRDAVAYAAALEILG